MPYCPECGAEVGEGATFCPSCGAQLEAPEVSYRRPRRGWPMGRIIALLFGGIMIVASVGLLAGGAAIGFIESNFGDPEGFMVSRELGFTTGTHALVSSEVDVYMDVRLPLFLSTRPGDLVTIKLEGESNDPTKEIFIGIARGADASVYLSGVRYEEVSDVSWSFDPWREAQPRVSYSVHPGGPPSHTPASMTFWEASTTGPGTQTLEWEPETGTFWVVVMNADGSAGVDVSISFGARVPILSTVRSMLLAGGFIALAIGGLIIYLGAIRRS